MFVGRKEFRQPKSTRGRGTASGRTGQLGGTRPEPTMPLRARRADCRDNSKVASAFLDELPVGRSAAHAR